MKYEISNLQINDIDSLIELLQKIFNYKIFNYKSMCQLVNNDNVIDLVVKVDNKVIGHAMVEIHHDLFTNEKYFYLNNFCVDEEYRCKGIGNELFKLIEEYALKNNISFMRFTSGNYRKEAHQFYKSRGYTIRDTSVFIKYFNN